MAPALVDADPAARAGGPAVFSRGLRISGGLALVGAVVAEFVAGSGGFASGLAYRIMEAGYRLEIARMFAALVLLSAAGVAINMALGAFAAGCCAGGAVHERTSGTTTRERLKPRPVAATTRPDQTRVR